jgi:hypothetical protein
MKARAQSGRVLAAATLAVGLLAACGIPVEGVPRALPTGSSTPTAASDGAVLPTPFQEEATLWFVKGGALVPAVRPTTGPATSQGLLDLLAEGPTPAEEAAGVRSAVVSVVTGEPLVVTAEQAGVDGPQVSAGTVVIVLEPQFTELLSAEQVLVLGEVVTTLAVGPVRNVVFVDEDGQELGVPTADGRLAKGPVSPADYASLIG